MLPHLGVRKEYKRNVGEMRGQKETKHGNENDI
jgi:hypothetical protein